MGSVREARWSPGYHGSMENMINIRDLSIRCGNCNHYQTLTSFRQEDGYNVYVYECENDSCRPGLTKTLLEIPEVLDLFFHSPAAPGNETASIEEK